LLERLGAVTDLEAKPDDALTLLEEIRGTAHEIEPDGDPTAGGDGLIDGCAGADVTHTVSLIRSPEKNSGPPSENPNDEVWDFDKE